MVVRASKTLVNNFLRLFHLRLLPLRVQSPVTMVAPSVGKPAAALLNGGAGNTVLVA